MSLNWLAFDSTPRLDLSLSQAGYIVFAAYLALTLLIAVRTRSSFRLSSWGWLLLAATALAAIPLSRLAVLTFDTGTSFDALTLAPFSLVPLVVAALWLGAGPALLTGLVMGLSLALFDTHRVTQPLELALTGAALAAMLRLPYRGRVASLFRQPVVAALTAGVVVSWPLALIGLYATSQSSALTGLERVAALLLPLLAMHAGAALIVGLLLQLVLSSGLARRPVADTDLVPAPWHRQLSQRMLYTFIPVTAVVIVLLVTVIAGTAHRVATGLVVDQMARDASTASGQMPFFIQVGRSLIRNLANDSRLAAADDTRRATMLAEGLRAVPYFQQLIMFDTAGQVAGVYPPETNPALAEGEIDRVRLALEGGIPGEVTTVSATGSTSLTFVAELRDEAGAVAGALAGRTVLTNNPVLAPVVDVLYEGFVGPGEGFLIDDQNQIILYPAHPELERQTYPLTGLVELPSGSAGQAFRQQQADGTRELIYLLPVTGRSDWSIVMTVPNEVVLALAFKIALPTLLLMIVIAGAALPLLAVIIQDVTVPLERLAQAASHIAEGELNRPLDVEGEDEIGRLGHTFEQMRLSLGQRLTEQQRLLEISRSVSSSLQGYRAMQQIVESAIDLTGAVGGRIVLLRGDDRPPQAFAAGELGSEMVALDEQILTLVEKEGPMVVRQMWRATGALDTSQLAMPLGAVVALPLRSDRTLHGFLWLAYDEEHDVGESELTFVSTLAEQAAVAAENVSLFGQAEEGRRKLAAVLESTADGIVVVDNTGRVVLMNPAAEAYFGTQAEQVTGRRASTVIDSPRLARLMTDMQEPVAELELPRRNSQIILANTSTIVSQDGSILGRVAVLRDITALKELDTIKTVFLTMVSHDLRSPLTFMRGFLSMVPIEGPLNERQKEALDRVRVGIDQLTMMTERISYLNRLQFGEKVNLELAMFDVEALIGEVVNQHVRLAQQKDVRFRVKTDAGLPLLCADVMLYRQAISNLVHNALKYSPQGTEIGIHAYLDDTGGLAVSVSDAGIGIRTEDQQRLFEAFYRVPQHEGDPERPKGSGLGLALVKAIAEAHEGAVHVESAFREGSMFTFVVPVREL